MFSSQNSFSEQKSSCAIKIRVLNFEFVPFSRHVGNDYPGDNYVVNSNFGLRSC